MPVHSQGRTKIIPACEEDASNNGIRIDICDENWSQFFYVKVVECSAIQLTEHFLP
ncbi:hypothetical protein KIN20_009862 [Parelaphostrongylus tenuis]|uniref:Uncharacterized protein n=1 Tax=Parelaphostrongylus tenuis TaxID=148309 RepID=A0AAD5M710_PARTN|nr:hypothetical protein KIN20_009862 [Parelaphostrongylus tenuis]